MGVWLVTTDTAFELSLTPRAVSPVALGDADLMFHTLVFSIQEQNGGRLRTVMNITTTKPDTKEITLLTPRSDMQPDNNRAI